MLITKSMSAVSPAAPPSSIVGKRDRAPVLGAGAGEVGGGPSRCRSGQGPVSRRQPAGPRHGTSAARSGRRLRRLVDRPARMYARPVHQRARLLEQRQAPACCTSTPVFSRTSRGGGVHRGAPRLVECGGAEPVLGHQGPPGRRARSHRTSPSSAARQSLRSIPATDGGRSWPAHAIARRLARQARGGAAGDELGHQPDDLVARPKCRLDDLVLKRGTRLARDAPSSATATTGPRHCTLASDDRHRPTSGGPMSETRSTKIRVIRPEDVIWDEKDHAQRGRDRAPGRGIHGRPLPGRQVQRRALESRHGEPRVRAPVPRSPTSSKARSRSSSTTARRSWPRQATSSRPGQQGFWRNLTPVKKVWAIYENQGPTSTRISAPARSDAWPPSPSSARATRANGQPPA